MERADVRDALVRHDFGRVFALARQWGGISFLKIADACDIKPERVGRLAKGEGAITTYEKIVSIADGLRVPGHMIGLAPRPWERSTAQSRAGGLKASHALSCAAQGKIPGEGRDAAAGGAEGDELRRREFLAGGFSAFSVPALGLDEIRHITAALEDARRYFDGDVLGYFRERMAWCMVQDGTRGPGQTLPAVLGIIGAVESTVKYVKPQLRQELLAVGAQSAEFAGWLCRDARSPGLADYWRDRAIEWARESGNDAMQAYVLLKKSQAAWDVRNPMAMLELAQAVRDGAWVLPPKVRAEAVQQEARGYAMLGNEIDLVEHKLEEAHEILEDSQIPVSPRVAQLGAHYNADLLALQTAICYCEAGCPQRAVEIYQERLSAGAFSRRDHGYFLSLMSGTLALAGEPDEASRVGIDALAIALETASARTAHELEKVMERLKPWEHRASVREFREAMAA